MRIVFFSHYFPPEVNAPATRTYEHLIRWRKQGHDITVITCAPNCPAGIVFGGYKNRFPYDTDEIDGIQVIRAWTFISANKGVFRRSFNFFSYFIMATIVGLFVKRPDVIVCTSPQIFCAWAGVLVAKLRRIKVVLEIRDIWPASIKAVGAMQNRMVFSILTWLEKTMYRWSDRIVAVGNGYRDHIVDRLGSSEKVSVITNGVDVAKFYPLDKNQEFLAQNNCQRKFICTYIGTIGMAHGLEVIIRAATTLKAEGRDDIKFLLAGDGARREDLERMADDADVTDYIRFLGMLPKSEVQTVIASSDALLVHLKKNDLFESVIPSKIFEIMAMHRPIILGVDGEVRKIVEEAGAGTFMTPESDDELTDILTSWSDNRDLVSEYSQSARRYVEEHYNRDKLAETYLELLEELVRDSESTATSSVKSTDRKAVIKT